MLSLPLDKLAWCITGAGHYILESIEVMETLLARGFKITVFISQAGLEVVRIYGLENRLRAIANGSYYRELVGPSDGASCAKAGRLLMKMYRALIVSPATANTVAKIVRGIADTPPTIAVAQALKGGVKVVIVPTDIELEYETETPHMVDRAICEEFKCQTCRPIFSCPVRAFDLVDGLGHIDLSKCIGCSSCIKACPFGAVKFRVKVKARSSPIDLENVKKLMSMKNVVVLKRPADILCEI
ncbi:MAG: 4Fe-4S binding protein [Candidatus Nezhaarchaeota archaeon]|nr:4Fe-4S binding protein [Candidatus Nezhaarchaeota archaeon]MCX8141267.1 4Fe-4S binding protein [Candidatus Nezhaarchaeota archaeon]MDW8049533.1 flavoprotein [Nitrososphaerota archaeon]